MPPQVAEAFIFSRRRLFRAVSHAVILTVSHAVISTVSHAVIPTVLHAVIPTVSHTVIPTAGRNPPLIARKNLPKTIDCVGGGGCYNRLINKRSAKKNAYLKNLSKKRKAME